MQAINSHIRALSRGERVSLAFCGVIFLLGIVLLTTNLSQKPFWDYDEAIYANVIHETAASDNPLTLHDQSGPFFEKPPLYFWLAIGADALLHHPELSYRLPGALSGIATVLLSMAIIYMLSRRYLFAAGAGAILLTSPAFMEASRQVRLDGLATLCTIAGVYCFIKAKEDPRWYIAFGAALALGFLSKSVIGLFALPILLVWAVVFRQYEWLFSRHLYYGVGVFIIILLPWHLYQYALYGSNFLQVYVIENLFSRVNENLITRSYTNLQYGMFFLIYGAPWSVLSLPALGYASRMVSTSVLARWALVFLTSGFLLLGVFLVASTKILYYLVPVYPVIGIGVALSLAALYEHVGRGVIQRVLIGVACAVIVGAAFFTYTVVFHRFGQLALNDAITEDEYQAAMVLNKQPEKLPIKAIVYDYYDTIRYYTKEKSIVPLNPSQMPSYPFYLITRTAYIAANPIPQEFAPHFLLLYQGFFITLYRVTP